MDVRQFSSATELDIAFVFVALIILSWRHGTPVSVVSHGVLYNINVKNLAV